MRVALYARVSTKDKGQDTENQLSQLRKFCERQGWRVVREYVDHLTGKTAKRDEFQQMFEAASRREFDLVVTWALDRLTREGVPETFLHIKRLRDHGVEFVSFTEEHFRTTGAAGELMIAIAAWIAKQERQRLVERTLAGLAMARKAGRVGGRPKKIVDRGKIRERRAAGATISELVEEFKVSRGFVHKVTHE